eukprot:CAMPEP_0201285590 /NCGR_PEP_ID=MMETSP1317-20130820/113558_1 /ASSEMBLY_ACC=CAM_ASM_000770 /TAXON_ID=187299 /ORGANISM="Undescribed Undescribed, Strain Undescribed" /LENGTH=69 /DNA_ID=CAMNT_0047611201 /DNA_START=419 /DNA_END=628 /DNA_ORIENTATION=+
MKVEEDCASDNTIELPGNYIYADYPSTTVKTIYTDKDYWFKVAGAKTPDEGTERPDDEDGDYEFEMEPD